MKKLINNPDDFVEEMLDGLVSANPSLLRDPASDRVIRSAQTPVANKVGVVSGGGSGHLPLFTGYVGDGLLDACAIGEVFAGPTVGSCETAIRAANSGRGVLCLYGNYGGDKMNFDLACEMLEDDGIETATVLGTDDIASADPGEAHKRRGVAGIVYAFKAAGATAAQGADLADVARVAAKAVDNCRTIGCALSPCQLPGADAPNFVIGDDEIEIGMGIHGEPGIWRDTLKPVDEIVDEMVERLLRETPQNHSGRVSVLINSLGATPLEELFIMYRRVRRQLGQAGFEIVRPLVGHYVTSMEMAGASISIIHLDDELESLLAAPADCPFWKV